MIGDVTALRRTIANLQRERDWWKTAAEEGVTMHNEMARLAQSEMAKNRQASELVRAIVLRARPVWSSK